MVSERRTIDAFLKRASLWVAGLAFLRGVTRAVPVMVGGLVLMAGLDVSAGLSTSTLKAFWIIVVFSGFGLFCSAFFPLQIFLVPRKSKQLSLTDRRFREDDLYIAAQFSSRDGELVDQFSESMAARLKQSRPRWCAPKWNWKPAVLLSTVLIAASSVLYAVVPASWRPGANLFFPFAAGDLTQIMVVEPGDASVTFGTQTKIQMRLLVKTIHRPVLYLRIDNLWQEMQPTEEEGPLSRYTIKNIVEPVVYRVGWRKEFSRKYTLTPTAPVELTEFSIVLTPPAYIRKDPTKQAEPEITALPGTNVKLDVWSSEPIDASMKFSDGRQVPVSVAQGARRTFEFTVEKETSYTLGTPSEYPIHTISDGPPQLTLLSPSEDLVVGEKEKIPLTYDARDDFGLGKIRLLWEKNGRPQNPIVVEQFDSPKENVLGTYDWDMGRFGFSSGDQIRYQLEALDANTVTGPGVAASPWRIIEIAGFDREHAAIEAALEDWREKAIELLAKVNTLQNRVDKDNPEWADLANQFNETADFSKKVENYLDRIVSKMENDPLADYGVWMEHKAMGENLRTMNESTVKRAQSALQTQNRSEASGQMKAMASELERMLALSEDLSKTQKARDVLESGDRLEELAKEMVESLEAGKLDAEAKSKVDALLKEAFDNLAKMAQSLQQMPESLPEDFVNQEALKDLKMGETKDIMSQIRDAMQRGDAKTAMSLAQSFLKATQQMQKSLSQAHESFLESRSASEMQKKVDEQQQALNEVIEEQAQILSETQKLESKRWGALLKDQGALLDDLAERQAKAVSLGRSIGPLAGQLPSMEAVLGELRRKQIDQSPEWLRGLLAAIEPITSDMTRSSAPAAQIQGVGSIRADEQYILDRLSKPIPSSYSFSKDDIQTFSELKKRQGEVQAKTQDIRKELQNLSRKTASLSTSLMQSLGTAGSEMAEASKKLSENNSQQAQRHEELALSELLAGSAQLQQAQSSMAEMVMQQNGGQGGGGAVQAIARPSSSSGGSGQRSGRVRLPKSDEYRPPKEFREDLLEALKEKYPKIYEGIIHKYYKRLVE